MHTIDSTSTIPSSVRPAPSELKIISHLVDAWEEYVFAFADENKRLPSDTFRQAIVQAQEVILSNIGERLLDAELDGAIHPVLGAPQKDEP